MDVHGQTQQGATHNTDTGKTHIPNPAGGVTEEMRKKWVETFGEDGPPLMSKEVYQKFVEAIGAQAEDAKARGMKYEPRLVEKFTNLANKNLTPVNLLVAVAVGGGVYYLGKKGGQWLARKMGWPILGNVVVTEMTVQGEEIGRLRQTRPPRNIGTPSNAPTASA